MTLWQAIQAQRRARQPSRPSAAVCRVCGQPVVRKQSELRATTYSACSRRCAALGRKRL